MDKFGSLHSYATNVSNVKPRRGEKTTDGGITPGYGIHPNK